MVCACNSSTWEEEKGPEVHSHPPIYSEFETSLGYKTKVYTTGGKNQKKINSKTDYVFETNVGEKNLFLELHRK